MNDDLINFWYYFIGIMVILVLCRYKNYTNGIPRNRENNRTIQVLTINNLNNTFLSRDISENNIERINIERIIRQNNEQSIQIYTKVDTYNSDKKINCTICLDDLEKKDKIRFLPCFHIFHKECIDPWLINKATCPNCCEDISLKNSSDDSDIEEMV